MEKHSLTTPFLFNRMGLQPQPAQSRGHKRLGGLTFAAIALATQAVSAADLTAWNYNPTTQQLEVTAKAGIQPKFFVMAQPARIVLDLPDTEMGAVQPKASFEHGVIRQVRVSQFQPGVTRVVLELAPDVELAPGQAKLETQGDRLILRPLIAGQPAIATKPTPQSPTAPPTPTAGEPAPPPLNRNPAPVPLAIGADISPVTSEPPVPSQVAVPPLVTPPAPIAVPPLLNSPAPVAVPPLATPPAPIAVPPLAPTPPTSNPAIAPSLPAVTPLPVVAQLPPEATTPLPPEVELPSSRLIVEGNNSITISVPPPVALPPTAPPVGIAPAPAPQPLPNVGNAASLQQTTPARSLQTMPANAIAVPPLPPAPAPLPLPSVTPLPPTTVPPMTVPPLAPVTVSPAPPLPSSPSPYPIAPTTGRITTKMGGQPTGTIQIQPSQPVTVPVTTAPTKPPVTRQPPASWVMQPGAMPPTTLPPASVSPAPINVPPAAISVPPAPIMPPTAIAPAPMPNPVAPPRASGQVVTAPNSWVMQSSGLSQPSLVQPLPQPPMSSVIQPPVQPAIAPMPMPVASEPQPVAFPAAPMGPTPTVSVPPLPTSTTPAVSVPPLQPAPLPSAPMPINPTGVVEFGQPLPTQGAASLTPAPVGLPTAIAANSPMSSTPITNSSVGNGQIIAPRQTGVAQSINPAIALPAGTVLALSYPGVTELPLNTTTPRQEMLVLQTEVRDASGNVVFPRGSYVMGRFEAGRTGTKFTTSAIQRGDRIVPFLAESDAIGGGSREISPTSMAIYSGAGALAGGLVSSFSGWGLLLGGAAGAATNYLTSPKPGGTVQPGQVIPVRMLQDIPF